MGDNIHLGDRDGVRTPMQWSPDRNGGFSRADPAALVLPPIMDPLYGYQAVNVEAQARDPHSLLNWMRRMLAVRTPAPARSAAARMRFLYPEQPQDARLSARDRRGRRSHPVRRQSRRARRRRWNSICPTSTGRVPVEMIGGSRVPADRPADLSADAAALRLLLVPAGRSASWPAWHAPAPEPLPEFATIVMRRGIAECVGASAERGCSSARRCRPICRSAAGSPRRARRCSARASPMPCRCPAATPSVVLAEIETAVGDDGALRVCRLASSGRRARRTALPQQLALARVRRGPRVGLLTDAFALAALSRWRRSSALRAATYCRSARGRDPLRADLARWPRLELADGCARSAGFRAEQSNSSLDHRRLAGAEDRAPRRRPACIPKAR